MRMKLQGSARQNIHEKSCKIQQNADRKGTDKARSTEIPCFERDKTTRQIRRNFPDGLWDAESWLKRIWMKWRASRAAWEIVIDGITQCHLHQILLLRIL